MPWLKPVTYKVLPPRDIFNAEVLIAQFSMLCVRFKCEGRRIFDGLNVSHSQYKKMIKRLDDYLGTLPSWTTSSRLGLSLLGSVGLLM